MAFPISKTSIANLLQKVNHTLILPALQRDFVWKPKDICKLFDSLMLGYPINTMMFWQTNQLPSQPISFYEFLHANYIEGNNNPNFNTKAVHPSTYYHVVIDGQQRITSLWIGLTGSYKTQRAKTPSELYLRLDNAPINLDLKYDFQFLTPSKLKSNQKKGEVWFKVSNILNPSFKIISTLQHLGLLENDYAQQTLDKLRLLVIDTDVINYYDIASNNIDDVLEIFVRTNSGGYALKKGDLLMSALTVNWANNGYGVDARVYVEDIVNMVKMQHYAIDKDWVFNVFLMLFSKNSLSLQPSKFMSKGIPQDIFNNNAAIKDSIEKAFDVISSFHLLEKGLTTKLAVVPIVYYIYTQRLQKKAILSTNNMTVVYDDIRKFLFRSIVKNLFEASTDDTLMNIRDIIDAKANTSYFPYAEIEDKYNDLKVTNTDVDDLLSTRKSNAFPILNIIYALGYDYSLCSMKPEAAKDYDVDHMHPKATFTTPTKLSAIKFTTPQDNAIAKDGVTFDTVVNLELLEDTVNRSKNKQPLNIWLASASSQERLKLPKDHFFDGLSINEKDFGTFVDARKQLLRNVLTNL